MPQALKDLKKLDNLDLAANDALSKLPSFNHAELSDGVITAKHKELIELAVHQRNTKKAGAAQEELAEVSLVAAAIRAGGAYPYGTQLLGAWQRLSSATNSPPREIR